MPGRVRYGCVGFEFTHHLWHQSTCRMLAYASVPSLSSALLRLLMEFLRFLLQLIKAPLGIEVDGILCYFALRSVSAPEAGA